MKGGRVEEAKRCNYLETYLWILLLKSLFKTGRSRDRFPMVSLEFFIDIILPAALWLWDLLSL
jgi:hypothetical protein